MKSLSLDICALYIFQLTACAYAAGRGGKSSRGGAAMLAVIASVKIALIAILQFSWDRNSLLLAADLILFAGLVLLLLLSRHYWPIWATAFQLTGVSLYFFPAGLTPAAGLTLPAAKIFWTALLAASLAIGAHEHRPGGNVSTSPPDKAP